MASSEYAISSWAIPMRAASAAAASASRGARLSERAVTASARPPSAARAAHATSAESAPPEYATSALPRGFEVGDQQVVRCHPGQV